MQTCCSCSGLRQQAQARPYRPTSHLSVYMKQAALALHEQNFNLQAETGRKPGQHSQLSSEATIRGYAAGWQSSTAAVTSPC